MIITETLRPSNTSDLMHRCSGGLDITLLWNRDTGAVTLELIDNWSDVIVEFDVPPERAVYAFNHPYAYSYERMGHARKAMEAVAA
jgi:hypothetical protein